MLCYNNTIPYYIRRKEEQTMAKENAILDKEEQLNEDLAESFDFDTLEEKLQSQLEEELADMQFLAEEKEKIGSPDNLGNVIMDVVWEQFINQVAVTAGEDFIEENRGLRLDLRDSAHIQTAENFAKGKIATHNYMSREQLEQNYDRYKNTPHKKFRDEYVDPGMNATLKRAGELKKQGIDTVTDIYTGKQIPTETKLANGKNNPDAAQREHVNSSAKLYENASLQMANSNEELAAIINDPENLQGYTTAERNNRKSDKSADEMDDIDKTEHWKKTNEKAEKFVKQKEEEGENRLKEEGRKTQKEEAFRIGGKALRAVLMQLLAELVREIIAKLVKWFKSSKKALDTLLDGLKEAIHSFIGKMKQHLINAGNTLFTTVATAIWGPIVGTIKKVWIMLKQVWSSLKNAIAYIKDPANRGKPIGRLLMEVGKIVIAGMTGIGAMALGEVIEKGLMTIPIFAFEIPLLGSLANILGIFLGAVVVGIIGAIAISIIEKQIEKSMEHENVDAQIKKGNEILRTQHQLQDVNAVKLSHAKAETAQNIRDRHVAATNMMAESVENIRKNCATDERVGDAFDDIDKLFDELED